MSNVFGNILQVLCVLIQQIFTVIILYVSNIC